MYRTRIESNVDAAHIVRRAPMSSEIDDHATTQLKAGCRGDQVNKPVPNVREQYHSSSVSIHSSNELGGVESEECVLARITNETRT
jgi:hypothetical protein